MQKNHNHQTNKSSREKQQQKIKVIVGQSIECAAACNDICRCEMCDETNAFEKCCKKVCACKRKSRNERRMQKKHKN